MATQSFYSDIQVFGEISSEKITITGQYSLPLTDGTAGQVLMADGSGNVNFQTITGFLTTSSILNGTGINWSVVSPGVLQGNVTLAPFTTANLAEGSNLYFTNERVDDRVANLIKTGLTGTGANSITWSYNDATGALTPTVSLTPFSTSNLAEGSNLYFTNERVDDRVANLIKTGLAGTGPNSITWSYNDATGALTPTVSLTPFSTSNLAEGSNLYFTNERVDDRVATLVQDSATVTWSYNDGLGTLTATAISGVSSINVEEDGSPIGTRDTIDFITGTATILTVTDDLLNSKVTVQYDVDLSALPDPVILADSGTGSSVRKDNCNAATGDYSTVSGGYSNTASCYNSTVSGGYCNTASGYSSIVSGGCNNTAFGSCSTVSGGYSNYAYSTADTIAGGNNNIVGSASAILSGDVVSGGCNNYAVGGGSTVGGGYCNGATTQHSTVSGGYYNTSSGLNSSVSGGYCNTASGCNSSILGGCGNTASCDYSGVFGCNITSVCDNTFHVNNLNIYDTPTLDSCNLAVLVRGNNGMVNYKTVGALFVQTADSSTVTATVAETTIIGAGLGTLTVGANQFSVGDAFRVRLGGVFSMGNMQTIQIKAKSGAVVFADTGALSISTTTAKAWDLTIDFTIRAIGAAPAAEILSHGVFTYKDNNITDYRGQVFNTLETSTFDTTGSNTLDVTVTFGSTAASNSIYSTSLILEKIF